MFDELYERFLKEQIQGARGQRKERLLTDSALTGTRILLEKVVFPVLGSFGGIELEHELKGLSNVHLYYDACYMPLKILLEEDHYVTHAELISRGRFSMERMRMRAAAVHGYVYFPYSRDELLKNPDSCANQFYELVSRLGAADGAEWLELPLHEREIIRCAAVRMAPFGLADAAGWLRLSRESARRVLRDMENKGLLRPVGGGSVRCFKFMVTEKAQGLFQRK